MWRWHRKVELVLPSPEALGPALRTFPNKPWELWGGWGWGWAGLLSWGAFGSGFGLQT